MPNWCNNTVEINHPDKTRMYALVAAINEGRFCDHVIPVPEDLKITAGFLGDSDAQKELEIQTANNLDKHGYGNWYDFCVGKWGTKWDVDPYEPVEYDDQHDKNGITFGFDSAWAPPIGIYEELIDLGFTVRAYYYEPGMAFAGLWDNGGDDYYEIGGMTSDQVRDELPSALDEMFAIRQKMSEYEGENDEEDAE